MFDSHRNGIVLEIGDLRNVIKSRTHNVYCEPDKGIGRTAPASKVDWTLVARSGALRPISHTRRL